MRQINDDPRFLCLPPAASSLINRRIAEIEAQVASGQSVEGLYLTHLLSSDKLSRSEIYTCIAELLLGGVDTVRSHNFIRFLVKLSRMGELHQNNNPDPKQSS